MSVPSTNMRVLYPNTTPPGAWHWRAPDGQSVSSIAFNDFVHRVSQWHQANGVEFDRETWEDKLCQELRIENSHCGQNIYRPEPEVAQRSIGLADLKRFIDTVRELVRQDPGTRFVDQEEAERRAEICSKCPLNRPVSGCFGCSGIVSKLKDFLGGRTTRHDKNIQSCTACGCALGAKVWVSGEVLERVERINGVEYHEDCWVPGVGRIGE